MWPLLGGVFNAIGAGLVVVAWMIPGTQGSLSGFGTSLAIIGFGILYFSGWFDERP